MSNFIRVTCKTPGNMGGTHTPHRFWPNGETKKVEVVPDEATVAWLNAHRPERRGNDDPHARRLQIAGGPYLPDGQPDPERITESGVKAIQECPHLSYSGDGGQGGEMQAEALDIARQLVERSNEKVATLEIQLEQAHRASADLRQELDKAADERVTVGKQLAELVQENDVLRKQVEAAMFRGAVDDGDGEDAGPEVEPETETEDGKGGKGGKHKGKDKGGK